MADEKSVEQVEEDLRAEYEDFGKEADQAVEDSREETEAYYEALRLKEEANNFSLRAYQQGEVLTPEQYLEDIDADVSALESQEEEVLDAQEEEQEDLDVTPPEPAEEEEADEASADAGDLNVSPQSEEQGAPVSPDQAAAKVGEGVATPAPVEEAEGNAEGDRLAKDVVADIEAADSVEAVDSLAEGDDRKTVQDAAEKRKAELSS